MAFVKLKCALPPRFFTDYLCLLKVEGRWQVAQKVFATGRLHRVVARVRQVDRAARS